MPQALLGNPGQRQVHVVAAQEQVIADRDSLQHRWRILAKPGPDQRQIGRATPDVDDEDQMHAAELRLQVPAVDARPVVERRLRLLQ